MKNLPISVLTLQLLHFIYSTCSTSSIGFFGLLSSSEDEGASTNFWTRNANLLTGKTLKVVFKLVDPGSEDIAGGTLELENGTTLYLDGGGVPVIWDLRDALNLTLEMYFADNWNPAWNFVANGTVDLGSPLRTVQLNLVNSGAMNTVAMLHPVLSMTSNVYFRQPPLGTRTSILSGPLSNDTLSLFFSCWLLCLFACLTIHHFSLTSEEEFSYSDLILWAVAIIHGRDYPIDHRNNNKIALRIAMLSSMCLSVMALAIYTAKIVSYFSVKSDAIKSPEDLLAYGYTLSSFSEVHVNRVFKNKKDQAKLLETTKANFMGGYVSVARLVDPKNPDPRYGFLTHPDGFYIYGRYHSNYSHELCGVSDFAASIKSARAMYIQKGSEFRELINWQILQLVERGLNHRHQISLQRKYKFSCIHQKQQFEELSLQHTFLTFLILIFGACLSLFIEIVFLVSRIFQSIQRQNQWHKLERSESTLEYEVVADG
ncbi:unnamed protein product [Orchesella dallaii]|uniref:Uncharacterized protein n=1 Tax=Orchesella dallaii TaxID=48710 RepID=A0ABP1QHJ6_9HEXA